MKRRGFRRALVATLAAAVLLSSCAATQTQTRTVVYRPAPGQVATASALSADAAVMSERITGAGIAGADVSVQGDEVVVHLPSNNENVSAVLDAISSPAWLYFRPVLCAAPAYDPPAVAHGDATSARPRQIPTSIACPAASRFSSADYSAADDNYTPPSAWAELSQYASTPPAEDAPSVPVLLTGTDGYGPRLLLGPAVATGSIAAHASAQATATGQWVVALSLTKSGTAIFNAAANRYYESLLANDLGGTLLDAPIILAKSFDNGVQIGPQLTQLQASTIALILNSGPLPVRLSAAP
jgi:preprotein translocase subunit SecD